MFYCDFIETPNSYISSFANTQVVEVEDSKPNKINKSKTPQFKSLLNSDYESTVASKPSNANNKTIISPKKIRLSTNIVK